MKYTLSNYKKIVGEFRQANNTIKQLKKRIRSLINGEEERRTSKKIALLRSEIKQLKEASEFKRHEIDRLKSEAKLPWFLAALLFSLLIWSLILCWSLLL